MIAERILTIETKKNKPLPPFFLFLLIGKPFFFFSSLQFQETKTVPLQGDPREGGGNSEVLGTPSSEGDLLQSGRDIKIGTQKTVREVPKTYPACLCRVRPTARTGCTHRQ